MHTMCIPCLHSACQRCTPPSLPQWLVRPAARPAQRRQVHALPAAAQVRLLAGEALVQE